MAAMSRRHIYLPVAFCLLVSLLDVCWAQDDDEDMPDDMDGDYGGMGGMDEDGDMGGPSGGGDDDIPGVLQLDTHTFDKVVSLPSRTTLVKFDKTFPSSENQDAFRELAQMAAGPPDFFLAECKFQDGDDDNDDNKDLKKRFGFATEDYPKYMFFKGAQDNITYDGKIDADDIARWVRKQGVKLRRVGLVPALDEVVHKFMKSGASEGEISNAKALVDKDHKEDASAHQYVKIMTKIKEKGHDYIDKEFTRVSKVLEGQIAEQKRTELQDKKKILSVFASSKDEL